MADREIPGSGYDNETKNKILDVATELFALKGFGSVSMRDIAKEVGIKMSSIYYYYEGKEALLEDVLARFEKGYRHYFDWLTAMNKKADSLETLMDNMFNKEFIEMRDPMGCLGMSLAIKEQHNNKSARRCVFKLFYEFSVKRMQADFDRLIKKGIIPPSDTKTIARLFMFCVIASNDIRLHEYAGTESPMDTAEIYKGLKNMITNSLASPN
ncbi:MAG: TetR/AcrR family transcriptional regulator [Oscillospiraceae bacterium]|nr:TetR/AcrR family transcriptional regulator [Oscillospiraceae bacterium]